MKEDVSVALLVLAACLSAAAVTRLYGRPSSQYFPKTSSEFLAPARLEKIKAAARAALENDPRDIDALTELAVAAYQEGPEHALECIGFGQKALDLGALDERLFFYTAAAYETKGLNDYAAEGFEKYLRHRPQDLETRLRLGNLYYRVGELEKAQAAFQAVSQVRPGDPLVSFNLAVVLRDRRQWREGIDILAPILERDNTLPAGGFRVLGDLYRGVEDADRALASYRSELERSPDDQELLSAVAQTLDDAGRQDEALDAWKRVLESDPKNKQAIKRVKTLEKRKR